GFRLTAATFSPFLISRSTTSRPTFPVAAVTKIMVGFFSSQNIRYQYHMKNVISTSSPASGRRLKAAIRRSLRELRVQLSLPNYPVRPPCTRTGVAPACPDVMPLRGPLTLSARARHGGPPPATMTGILDRLERGGWVARDRDTSDRRGVVVRPLRQRSAELV